eukprot:CAMPEP_0206174980 /NCGR_PEP_ID=MMETSP1474-20131121/53653_1 /ASSEMBLY_ACC=CAM_ASM_001110 /TAXON_ID=97495 /ORGANISM="Imantonia sp., Strain RCC918" /LENGTH=233 /DNA_ID=CAMNT_0053584911 /DNA_START=341 /DNA_END=1038 /DNA_ORIENTATION=+
MAQIILVVRHDQPPKEAARAPLLVVERASCLGESAVRLLLDVALHARLDGVHRVAERRGDHAGARRTRKVARALRATQRVCLLELAREDGAKAQVSGGEEALAAHRHGEAAKKRARAKLLHHARCCAGKISTKALLLDHDQLHRGTHNTGESAAGKACRDLLGRGHIAICTSGDRRRHCTGQRELKARQHAHVDHTHADAAVEDRRVERERQALLSRVLTVQHRLQHGHLNGA